MADFMTPEWAEHVRQAVNREPDPEYKAGKLDFYWDWIDAARKGFTGTWALGVRDMPGRGGVWLALRFKEGDCSEASVVVGDVPDATFALAGQYEDWQAIMAGFDTSKAIMYRKLLLERGGVFELFDRVYFFTEALAVIGKVPTRFPAGAPA